jgi:dihydrofolate reductase
VISRYRVFLSLWPPSLAHAAERQSPQGAGDKANGIAGGNLAQQFLALGLVDEIFVHLVPVLFGAGTRLIDDLRGKHVQLETLEVINTREAVHLRFRVIK